MGATSYNIPFVALYDTLGTYHLIVGPETSEFILNHAEVPVLLTSIDKVGFLLELAPKCPKLKGYSN
jgi:long-chain acyl-CoA synthetase